MARLLVAKGAVERLRREPHLSAKVMGLVADFHKFNAQELREHKNIHLERHKASRDPAARTARLDGNHRAIIWDTGDDETYMLETFGTHDETDRWMHNNELRRNPALGVLESVNVLEIEKAVAAAPPAKSEAGFLYSHRRDRDFENLGIDPSLLPVVRSLQTEEALEPLLGILPPSNAEALLELLGDEPLEEIYPRLVSSVDASDLRSGSAAPASQGHYFVISDDEELQLWLDKPFALWRTYLHHSQRQAAYAERYDGPALVTGGPGTGKTVVALHRAKALAEQLSEPPAKQILLTTFHIGLARAIERDLELLGGRKLADAVEVVHIDQLRIRILEDSPAGRLGRINDDEALGIWKDVAASNHTDLSAESLQSEWEHVILATGCKNREDYGDLDRSTRGVVLDREQRMEVWSACEEFEKRLADRGEVTFSQIAAVAADQVLEAGTPRYRHVIVDEAQDLHQTQLRLLRALVAEGPDDLFIVGDSSQRIYDRRASLSDLGIDTSGRETELYVNYRTSHEIATWANTLKSDSGISDLGDLVRRPSSRHRSLLHGSSPICVEETTARELSSHLAFQVASWIEKGVVPQEIAVASRSKASYPVINAALSSASVDISVYEPGGIDLEGVRVSTMHSLKGLEFQCVALFDVNDESLPASWLLEAGDLDPSDRDQLLNREHCLLYMAATRARDELWVGWAGEPSRFLEAVLAPENT